MMLFISFVLAILLPLTALGKAQINEIMYDLEGADTGREWIEIYNNGDEEIDLSSWRLNEEDVNHKLIIYTGNGILTPRSFAIIADDPALFMAEWPGLSLTIFDSSFSLKQDGEQLILRDRELLDIDMVSYTKEWGASGDGNSLQRRGDKWFAGKPTPGALNIEKNTQEQDIDHLEPQASTNASATISEQNSNTNPSYQPQTSAPKIKADIIAPIRVVVGADFVVEGFSYGVKNEPILNARYIWNFGNGQTKQGKRVLHSYDFPGNYIIFLSIGSGEHSASEKVMVYAEKADMGIALVELGENGFIEVYNNAKFDIDISSWHIYADKSVFTFPANSTVAMNSKVKFGANVTGIKVNKDNRVALAYPSGAIISEYKESIENDVLETHIREKQEIIIKSPNSNLTENTQKQIHVQAQKPYFYTPPIQNTDEPVIAKNASIEKKEDTNNFDNNNAMLALSAQSAKNNAEEGGSYIWWLASVSVIVIFGAMSSIIFRRKHVSYTENIQYSEKINDFNVEIVD